MFRVTTLDMENLPKNEDGTVVANLEHLLGLPVYHAVIQRRYAVKNDKARSVQRRTYNSHNIPQFI